MNVVMCCHHFHCLLRRLLLRGCGGEKRRGRPSCLESAGRRFFRQLWPAGTRSQAGFAGVLGRDTVRLQACTREKKSGNTLSCETPALLVSYRPLGTQDYARAGFCSNRCHPPRVSGWHLCDTLITAAAERQPLARAQKRPCKAVLANRALARDLRARAAQLQRSCISNTQTSPLTRRIAASESWPRRPT
jgi:hypothetical protein